MDKNDVDNISNNDSLIIVYSDINDHKISNNLKSILGRKISWKNIKIFFLLLEILHF